jgi:hypothetical protein
MILGSESYQARAIADFVAARRAATGEKFSTCERMRAVFEGVDNTWPPVETISGETISAVENTSSAVETISVPARETISRRRGRPRRGEEGETISALKPWTAAGLSPGDLVSAAQRATCLMGGNQRRTEERDMQARLERELELARRRRAQAQAERQDPQRPDPDPEEASR